MGGWGGGAEQGGGGESKSVYRVVGKGFFFRFFLCLLDIFDVSEWLCLFMCKSVGVF